MSKKASKQTAKHTEKQTTKQLREVKTSTKADINAARRASLLFYDKYMLTIDETALYFHIGAKKMAQMIKDNPKAKWYLRNGQRTLIKKDMFAKWLDEQTEI